MKTKSITTFLLSIAILQLTLHAYAYTPPQMKWNRTYGGSHPDRSIVSGRASKVVF